MRSRTIALTTQLLDHNFGASASGSTLHCVGVFLVSMAQTLALTLLLISFLALASTIHIDPRDLDASFLNCYDYIIVCDTISFGR